MANYGNLLYNNITTMKPDWTPTRSQLRDPAELAKSLGITYDINAIQGRFDQATQAAYAAQQKQQAASENKFYNDMYNTQATAMDTIRRSNAEAIATGASRGMQAANELSSVLGLQQESVAGATELAAQRAALADEEMAAYAQNAKDAMTTANAAGATLGNIQSSLYASDTQFDVGQMDYYATLDASIKQLMGMQEQANATRYNADANAAAQRYAADKSYQAALASAASSGRGGSVDEDLAVTLDRYAKGGNKSAFIATLTANGRTEKQALAEWNELMKAQNGGSGGGGNTYTPTNHSANNYTDFMNKNPNATGMDYYYSQVAGKR